MAVTVPTVGKLVAVDGCLGCPFHAWVSGSGDTCNIPSDVGMPAATSTQQGVPEDCPLRAAPVTLVVLVNG